jgi:cbb3-type cytochrome oxidase subunit 3
MGKTPVDFYGNIIGFLLGFLGVAFLGYMIYAGYTWMLARGNQQEVDNAKRMIEQAIVGLVIVLAAYVITYAVGQIFFMTSDTTD